MGLGFLGFLQHDCYKESWREYIVKNTLRLTNNLPEKVGNGKLRYHSPPP